MYQFYPLAVLNHFIFPNKKSVKMVRCRHGKTLQTFLTKDKLDSD